MITTSCFCGDSPISRNYLGKEILFNFTQDSEMSSDRTIDKLGAESEVLQKIVDYSNEELLQKVKNRLIQ